MAVVFQRLREAKLKIRISVFSRSKKLSCVSCVLGHVGPDKGIAVDNTKIKITNDWLKDKSDKFLRTFTDNLF